MECLRKGEEKSENRRSIIVEAGALAVAANVEHLSLTSKNNIASIEQVRCEEFPSSKITNMTSPVYIQDKWNRSFVLMILLATSGFLVWNGVKWTVKTRNGDEGGQATESPNQVEECDPYVSFRTALRQSNWHQKFKKTFKIFNSDFVALTDDVERMECIQKTTKWMLESFENRRNNVEKVESSFQPYFFVWSLEAMRGLVHTLKKVDEALTSDEKVDGAWTYVVEAIIDAINEYQQEFLKKSPKFLSDCPEVKSRYDGIMSSLSGEYPQLGIPQLLVGIPKLKQENE